MIEETTKRINFSPYTIARGKKVDRDPAPTISISTKYKKIVFSSSVIKATGMANKFIRLYYEPQRKIIGWQIRDKIDQREMKVWKLCKPAPSTKMWSMSITKMLDEMKNLKVDYSYKNLPVKKYRELSKLSEHHGGVYYFIEIKENKPVEQQFELTLNNTQVTV